jgi:hypothetical protein
MQVTRHRCPEHGPQIIWVAMGSDASKRCPHFGCGRVLAPIPEPVAGATAEASA